MRKHRACSILYDRASTSKSSPSPDHLPSVAWRMADAKSNVSMYTATVSKRYSMQPYMLPLSVHGHNRATTLIAEFTQLLALSFKSSMSLFCGRFRHVNITLGSHISFVCLPKRRLFFIAASPLPCCSSSSHSSTTFIYSPTV